MNQMKIACFGKKGNIIIEFLRVKNYIRLNSFQLLSSRSDLCSRIELSVMMTKSQDFALSIFVVASPASYILTNFLTITAKTYWTGFKIKSKFWYSSTSAQVIRKNKLKDMIVILSLVEERIMAWYVYLNYF